MLRAEDFIRLLASLITILVFVDILVHFVLDAYHPVRRALDRLVEPMLAPIRRLMPQTGMWDLSPIVLLLLVQVVEYILLRLLAS
ncbi:MAG: YggT family protein [Anaerolineales bacterium]|nr:YggT family protein [Anaerolineales bacterium]